MYEYILYIRNERVCGFREVRYRKIRPARYVRLMSRDARIANASFVYEYTLCTYKRFSEKRDSRSITVFFRFFAIPNYSECCPMRAYRLNNYRPFAVLCCTVWNRRVLPGETSKIPRSSITRRHIKITPGPPCSDNT